MLKRVFVILDGLGDLPCKELDGRTPLEAAKTPNLDFFAREGCTGIVYPVGPKIAPESDQGVLGVLGYDPNKYYTGRGPLEAVGAKIRIKDGDLALRVNFGSIIGGKLVDRRVGRTLSTEEATKLAQAINVNVGLGHDFVFKNTLGHRGVLVIYGDFSDEITNVDPAYQRKGKFNVATEDKDMNLKKCNSIDGKLKSKITAEVVNNFVKQSYQVLKDNPVNAQRGKKLLMPANIILVRDAGVKLPDLPKKRNWAAIVGMPLEKGIAKLAGMVALTFEYPEPKFSKNRYWNILRELDAEIKAAKKYIRYGDYENYYVHIKSTDIAGHDGNAVMKKKLIEIVDKDLFKFLKRKNCEVVVTADHSTPCSLKRHSDDPVPLLWYSKGEQKDNIGRFDEKSCAKGSLGTLLGKDVMKKVGFE